MSTDSIPPERADEFFEANPDIDRDPYWERLALGTVDWDRLEITMPDLYTTLANEFVRVFMGEQPVTGIRLNMVNYQRLIKEENELYKHYKEFVLQELGQITGTEGTIHTLQSALNQFFYVTWKMVPAAGFSKDTKGTKTMQKQLTAMVTEPAPPRSQEDIQQRNIALLKAVKDSEKAAEKAANDANAKRNEETENAEEGSDKGGGGSGERGNGNTNTIPIQETIQNAGFGGPIFVQSKDIKIDPFRQPRKMLDIPEAFDRWWRQALIAFTYHGIKGDEEIYNAFIRFGGPDIDEEDRFGKTPQNLPPGASKLDILMAKLKKRYIPFDPLLYYRVRFLQSKPKPEEQIGAYLTRLRRLAHPCQWGELTDSLMLTVMLISMSDENMMIRALMDNYTLERLVARKAAKEVTTEQARFMSNGNGHGKESDGIIGKAFRGSNTRQSNPGKGTTKECFNCGREWPHTDGVCAAKGKTCNYCKKLDHFSIKCRKKEEDKQKGKEDKGKEDRKKQKDYKGKGKGHGKGKSRQSVKKAERDDDDEEEENDDSSSQISDSSFTK